MTGKPRSLDLRWLALLLALLVGAGFASTYGGQRVAQAQEVDDDDDGSGDDDDGVPDNDDDGTVPEADDDDAGDAARQSGRLAGADRFATSVAISQFEFPNGAALVYLARGDAFADALAGGSLTRGPILLVPACGALPAAVRAEIDRLDPQQVLGLGGPTAVCDQLLEEARVA